MTLALERIDFAYREKRVLTGFDLTIEPGQVVALLGPSGSGKSTVLRLVLGFETPSAGSIRIAGETVSRDGNLLVPPEERGLAVVFQDLALWPHLTVRGHLAFGLEARGVAENEQRARIAELFERLGLTDLERRYPGELSGGERQRVAIARALVLEPRAILLDEPLANLDVALKRELLALFRDLFAERRCTALYVTHGLEEAAALGDRIIVMEQGRIVQDGTLEALRRNPASAFVKTLLDGQP